MANLPMLDILYVQDVKCMGAVFCVRFSSLLMWEFYWAYMIWLTLLLKLYVVDTNLCNADFWCNVLWWVGVYKHSRHEANLSSVMFEVLDIFSSVPVTATE